MLDLLKARAREERLDIETHVMDGHTLELDDSSVDMAGSQFGRDAVSRHAEGRQRDGTRRQARLPCADDCLRRTAQNRILRLLRGCHPIRSSRFHRPPMDPLPLPFQLQDPERLKKELVAAGLKEIKVETITETTEFRTGKELWEWVIWSNPIAKAVLGTLSLTREERGIVQGALDKLVRERASGPAALANPINLGIGMKP